MNNWSTPTGPSYRSKLHKLLVANHNRRLLHNDPSFNSITYTDYIEHPTSPIVQIRSASFKTKEDGEAHHTNGFDLMRDDPPTPIFRRGQPFSIVLDFNRSYNSSEDFFHLILEFGPKPDVFQRTRYKIPLSEKQPENNDKWEMWLKESKESNVTIQVQIPGNCQVGLWKFKVCTYKANTSGNLVYDFPEDVFILFNPWSQSDDVYLDEEQERKEYVLNEHGRLWMGTNRAPVPCSWVFGQSDAAVLPAIILLLEQSDVPHSHRGSAVLIARALSAVLNSFNEDGLLVGKWEGNFDDGTKPFTWTGCVAFYDEFLRSGQPVKYAQCWVFSGALTTACRALGIPCRPVTGYVCAHDTNATLTVDKFFSRDGTLIEGGADGDCYDSTWNFHCWNDVWMARPDLPPGYDGWQALDATPQEESNQKFQTGPAPLKAIKEGALGFQYDTAFVFSEVNADLCHFREDSSSPWGFTRIKLDPNLVGKRIVTQSLVDNANGERGMDDITHLYKYAEGTELERVSVFNALKGQPKAQKYYKAVVSTVERDVFFNLKEVESTFVGESFSISLTVENHASQERNVKTKLKASSVLYTGASLESMKESVMDITLRPKEGKTVKMTVTPEDYHHQMSHNRQVKVTVFAHVIETKQTFSAEDDFEIIKRKLEIKVPEEIKVGNVSEIQYLIINPFIVPLNNCELMIEGPGLQRPKSVKLGNIPPNGQMRHIESMVPKRHGARVLLATFNSDQLPSVRGSKNIVIKP